MNIVAGLVLLAALDANSPIDLDDCLLLPSVGRQGREAVRMDPAELKHMIRRGAAPKAGDVVETADGGKQAWEAVKAKDGTLTHKSLSGGYVHWTVKSAEARIAILEASGHLLASVNGEPRAGDLYGNGIVNLPVALVKGDNQFLFHASSRHPALRARLVAPKSDLYLDGRDSLLPDVFPGDKDRVAWGAFLVVNAADRARTNLTLHAEANGRRRSTPVGPLLPTSLRKVAFELPTFDVEKGPLKMTIRLTESKDGKDVERAKEEVNLSVVKPTQLHRRTFRSDIDGSVQFYAVQPARRVAGKEPPALVLSLHGAAVDATAQAASYAPKTWATIVAPTNRRPFGFDWEDWGRQDALEVLAVAAKELGTDPRRVYLTGHSMGGHGTWHLGVTYPDLFAAVGPSAGWISFDSYTGGARKGKRPETVEMLRRAASGSDTLSLARNFSRAGVYVLHGDKDDNVPVGQARAMRTRLTEFHRDFAYHEQPGAGHWWDASDEDGVDCVDWSPMFDLFARRTLPALDAVRQVEFATVNPGSSSRCGWLQIEQQREPLMPSRCDIRLDPGRRRFRGTTENVALLALDVSVLTPDRPLLVELDGVKIENIAWPGDGRLHLRNRDGRWAEAKPAGADEKSSRRNGPFKEAFRNRMIFVHGTKGTKEENAWSLAKARYDAETFWYRGNGSVDVIADTAFDAKAEKDRNVILYGHAESNGAWKLLLAGSPVQVLRGEVHVGERIEKGDDLACLFVRPRPDSAGALVGVVSGTGVPGLRLTDRMPYFVSGTGFPDLLIAGTDMLASGDPGLRAAGFFGNDWSVKQGRIVWKP